jgi:hypothetical protein
MGIPEVKVVRAPPADFTLSRNVEWHKGKKKTQKAFGGGQNKKIATWRNR